MEELDLKELLSVFLKNKLIILLIVIVTTILGSIYSFYLVTPKYEASTTLILGRINNSTSETKTSTTDQITQSEISINSNLVSTYSELIKSRTLIQKVIDNLKLNLTESSVRNSISVSRISDTELIEITVKNEDGELASKIANEIAKVFSSKVEEVYNISNVYIIDKAIASNTPYNINHVKDIVIAIFIGVVISGIYVLIYHLLDNTIKSETQIEKNIGLKNLINIPLEKKKGKKQNQNELITYLESKSLVSESFRTFRTNVQFSKSNSKGGKTFLVSSCFPSEGKSYISANLAITFAQIGKKVILVDSDMRMGRQAEIFKISKGVGLSNYISGLDRNGIEISEDIGRYIKETEIANLNLITAGSVPPNPSELLSSPKLQELIENLKSFYDIIIFDGAPIIPITDSLILARNLESTIIVTLYNKTKKDDLLKVKNDIEAVGGKIIGTCINCMPVNSSKKESKYYYYREEKSRRKISLKARIYKLLNKIAWKTKCIKSKLKLLTSRKKIASLPGEVSSEFLETNKNIKINSQLVKNELMNKKQTVKVEKIKEKQKEIENEKIEQKKQQAKEKKIQEEIERQKNEQAKKQEEKAKLEEENKKKLEAKIKEKESLKAEKLKEKEKKLKEQQAREEEKQKIKALVQEGKAKEKEQAKKIREEKIKIAKENYKKFAEKADKKIKEKLEKVKEKSNNIAKIVKNKFDSKSEEFKKKYDEYIKKKAKERLEHEQIKEKLNEEKRIEFEKNQKIKQEEYEKKQKRKIAEQEKLKMEREELKKQKEIEQEKLRMEREELKKQKEIEQERLRKEKEEEKAKEKENAKLTDEYIEENLYPKTKNTKLF